MCSKFSEFDSILEMVVIRLLFHLRDIFGHAEAVLFALLPTTSTQITIIFIHMVMTSIDLIHSNSSWTTKYILQLIKIY